MKNYRIAILALLIAGAVLTGFPAGGAAALAVQQPPARAQDDGFVPVKDLGDQERLPAAPLVMGAYAVAWVAIFLYVWSIWRRLSRVETEIAAVSRRIADAARPGGRQ